MSPPVLDRYRAPQGFVLVRSHAEGVEVYAPAAVEQTLEERTRCPQCGAAIAWDPSKSALHCGYCDYTAEARQGEQVEEGEFTEAALARGARGWGSERPELHCEGCGAVLTIDPGHLATTCPFCGSNHVGVRQATEASLRPGWVVPFTVPTEVATQTATGWVGQGWLRPPGAVRAAHLDAFMGVYLPHWVFAARLDCRYECEVGVDRWETVYRNGKSERRRVTHWSWKSGAVSRQLDGVVVPGTERVAGLSRAGDWPLESLIPYTPDVLVGFAAQAYDVALPDAWERGRRPMRAIAAAAARSDAGGDRQRNFSAAVDFNEEAWRYALLPVWVSTYTWGGRSWVVLVNGATGEVGGTRPVAWGRVYLAIVALLTPGLFTGVCIGIPSLLLMGVGLIVWIFALILIIIGAIFSVKLYKRALGEERL